MRIDYLSGYMKGKLKYKQGLKVNNEKVMSLQYDSLSKVNAKSARKYTPTGTYTHVGMYKNVHSTGELEILPCCTKSDGNPTSDRRAMIKEK